MKSNYDADILTADEKCWSHKPKLIALKSETDCYLLNHLFCSWC